MVSSYRESVQHEIQLKIYKDNFTPDLINFIIFPKEKETINIPEIYKRLFL